jgi:nitrogen fixation/metabolism regulation signal transduction histidine kinase
MSHVNNLPTDRPADRPRHRTIPPGPPPTQANLAKAEAPVVAQENLARAFVTFTQAAGSLEKSYTQLQAEVSRLHAELQRPNSELERSLEENARMRGYLTRVVESLPCGVLVVNAGGTLQIMNPEARRLLGTPVEWVLGDGTRPPMAFAKAVDGVPGKNFMVEQEALIQNGTATRLIGVLRTTLHDRGDGTADTVWIVRDLTEQKRIAAEREAARKSLALAEIATILAHEIRNPLGSMELFTGLLADATAHLPETRQWITHLQAGLRALSATMTNVVDVYINYLRRKVDSGYERALIRTVRGVGYQIGGSAPVARSAAASSSSSVTVVS